MGNYLEDRTVFIVSHRISTVKNADKILVLDRGEVIEAGDHNALLAKGGYYSELCEKQMLEKELYQNTLQ
jgi:ABC-type multidrug transport system fused ATPase/permease subunit